jgi:hypothetical protein
MKTHKAHRLMPAMAAGITDKLWSVADIVRLVRAAEPKPGKRGHMKTAGSMSNILDDPQHWRARAEEMRQLANLASDITAKETILRIAYDYAQLAWYAEDRLKKDKNSN